MRAVLRRQQGVYCKLSKLFSGGGLQHYDWRDDEHQNPELMIDAPRRGIPDPRFYECPPRISTITTQNHGFFPPQYNVRDLRMNFVGTTGQLSLQEQNDWDPPIQIEMETLAHEMEYDSEDGDFQSMNFKTQHFRKKGIDSMMILASLIPFIAFFYETFYTNFFNSNWLVWSRPPPVTFGKGRLNDSNIWVLQRSKDYQMQQDQNNTEKWFDIVEGEKVYTKYAGVNKPHPSLPQYMKNKN